MASRIEVSVNNRPYQISCDEGQQDRVRDLVAGIDRVVGRLVAELGEIGDARLLLLAALTISDELADAKRRLALYDHEAAALDADTAGGVRRVIEATEQRITEMAQRLDETT